MTIKKILLLIIILSSFVYSDIVPDDTISYYKLEEDSLDYTDTVENSDLDTGEIPTRQIGIIDYGQFFNGVDEYLKSDNNNFDFSNDFSVSLWVKTDNSFTRSELFSTVRNDGGSYSGCFANYYPNSPLLQIICYYGGTNNFRSRTEETLIANEWNHLVFTNDDSTNLDIFINGEEVEYISGYHQTGTTSYNNNYFYLGTREELDYFFNDYIDEVSIFNKALSEEEIEFLYNYGSPNSTQQYPFISPQKMYLEIDYPNINNSISSWNSSIVVYSNSTIDSCSINSTDFDSSTIDNNNFLFYNNTAINFGTYYYSVSCNSTEAVLDNSIDFYINYFEIPSPPEEDTDTTTTSSGISFIFNDFILLLTCLVFLVLCLYLYSKTGDSIFYIVFVLFCIPLCIFFLTNDNIPFSLGLIITGFMGIFVYMIK